jgi:hypothetical protein
MLNLYTITINKLNEYDLDVAYSDEFKAMSEEDMAVALDDCIRLLKIELMSLTQS